jgi:7-cyano-7-deazaguanine synthase in queuosine biosynthesis
MSQSDGRTRFEYDLRDEESLGGVTDRAVSEKGVRSFIDDRQIAKPFGEILSPILADFLDVAVRANVTDRIQVSSRGSKDCSRRLTMQVPVRQPDVWNEVETSQKLQDLLEFLTGDYWRLTFTKRVEAPRVAESQRALFRQRPDRPVKVGLLSGGLDSFAGTSRDLKVHPDSEFVCVSAVTNHRHSAIQRRQADFLREVHAGGLLHVQVQSWLKGSSHVPQDQMRRTRGLLFLTLGLIVANQAQASELSVYENGVGAINLPYERGAIVRPNSRAVHPKTLRLTAELFGRVTGKCISISSPCLLETKSQVCVAMDDVFKGFVAKTYSCDSSGARRAGSTHCGTCTSCLLRRASLSAIGISEDAWTYAREARTLASSDRRVHMQGMDAMSWQAERISDCLKRSDRWEALLEDFPDLHLVVNELQRQSPGIDTPGRIISLYQRHCQDWHAFAPKRWATLPRKAA